MSKEVIVFTSKLCSYCHVAKDYLSSKGVQYIEKDVETDQEARLELIQKGITAVPVIKIEGELIVGFDKGRIDELLGL
ncbi:MAG: glutaredoxin family protein [Alkaliphilus sp.]|nr:glutaredoxin family protein [Alkaliphilus sp.]